MNCRTCGYALWNLHARTCPECGHPFLPSQFEFAPSSVQFKCPHCEQPYYGTDLRGHLVPREFDCVACNARIDMDQMVLLPTAGIAEERTRGRDRLPWAERTTRGFFRAWLRTIAMALFSPTRLMRAADKTPASSAWWFALFTATAAALTGVTPFALIVFIAGAGGLFFAAGATILVLVSTVVFITIWGLLAHLALAVTGPTAGIGRTYTSICFAGAVTILAAVPFVGFHLFFLVAPVWWGILAMLMLAESHKAATWRAVIAGGLAPLLTYGAIAGFAVWMSFMVSAAMSRANAAVLLQPTTQTQSFTNAIIARAAAKGQAPVHASELLGDVGPGGMIVTGTGTTKADVRIGPTTLERFYVNSAAERDAALQMAVEAMPANVIAHRWGDFVFTYHGIDFTQADGDLWIVIFSPDPARGTGVPPVSTPPARSPFGQPVATRIPVGTAAGTIVQIAPAQFAARLAEQNQLRAELGLPPLPDPAAVTHAAPALSSGP